MDESLITADESGADDSNSGTPDAPNADTSSQEASKSYPLSSYSNNKV